MIKKYSLLILAVIILVLTIMSGCSGTRYGSIKRGKSFVRNETKAETVMLEPKFVEDPEKEENPVDTPGKKNQKWNGPSEVTKSDIVTYPYITPEIDKITYDSSIVEVNEQTKRIEKISKIGSWFTLAAVLCYLAGLIIINSVPMAVATSIQVTILIASGALFLGLAGLVLCFIAVSGIAGTELPTERKRKVKFRFVDALLLVLILLFIITV